MALRYFRGRIDLDKLSLADLAAAASALATLESLGSTGVITFETGASRNAGPRLDLVSGQQFSRPQQQEDVISALQEKGTMNFYELLTATGMRDGSLSACLTALVREGLISKEVNRTPGTPGRTRRENITYNIRLTRQNSS